MIERKSPANDQTYIVIGSNSFTGSHIVDELLEDGSSYVIGISRSPENNSLYLPYKRRQSSNFKFHQVDLFRQPDLLISLLDEIQPTYVINVAALSEVALSNFQPVEYFQTNCLGIVKLCNRLRTRSYLKRYIHISTAEVYGNCLQPAKETAPLNPSTPYAASKAAADLYLSTLWKNFDFPVILIRSTNVYGKHQQLYKIIPRTLIFLKQGKQVELHAKGQVVRSFVHIRDVVRGLVSAMHFGEAGNIYNFSTRNDMRIAEVVQKICEYLGYDFQASTREAEGRLGQDAQYMLDFSKAQRELGWRSQVPFEDGLREVICWVDENWNEILREPHSYTHKLDQCLPEV